jgi:thioredoxin reductase
LFALLGGFGGVQPITILAVAIALIVPLFALASATLLASVWCRQTRDAVLALYVLGTLGGLAVWYFGGILNYFNPLYVIAPAWGAWRSLDMGELAQRLLVSSLCWGTLGGVCLAVAIWRLRPAYLSELENVRPQTVRWYSTARIAVQDWPVGWRERHVEGQAPTPGLRRVPQWLGVSAVAVLTTCSSLLILVLSLPPGVQVRDLMAALVAIYGASEGLRTLLLDRHAPGGQAGTSSRIENYLGFPTGVSGSELTRRAMMQAQRLGAEFLAPLEVTGVSIDGGYKRLALADGREIVTRAMLATTGMFYREHPAAGIKEHTGAGVYYGAAATEASAVRDRRVIVVGGGNSAGQGAIYLARYAKEVQIVVRRESLDCSMSRYLIEQIEKTPNIRVRPLTAITRVEGEGRVERVELASLVDGSGDGAFAGSRDESCAVKHLEEIDALFVFIGTRPCSDWLPPNVLRDDKGFVLTGRDLMAAEDYARTWKEQREPLPLETSVPGVFAAGDLRAGAMNRVASAVGEGSMVVRLTHEYLALT